MEVIISFSPEPQVRYRIKMLSHKDRQQVAAHPLHPSSFLSEKSYRQGRRYSSPEHVCAWYRHTTHTHTTHALSQTHMYTGIHTHIVTHSYHTHTFTHTIHTLKAHSYHKHTHKRHITHNTIHLHHTQTHKHLHHMIIQTHTIHTLIPHTP